MLILPNSHNLSQNGSVGEAPFEITQYYDKGRFAEKVFVAF